MWKALLIVLLLLAAGHVAVRYLRSNPLAPVVQGEEVVVETNEYEVRFAREGPAGGVYLIAGARSDDWTNNPQNALLSVIDFSTARAYLGAYPDFRHYGSPPGLQLENVASSIAVVAGNRIAYGDLLHVLDLFEERAGENGERICVGLSGEALQLASAVSLRGLTDHTESFRTRYGGQQALLASQVRVDDCAELLGQKS